MLGFIYFFAVFLASLFGFRWLYRAGRASAGVSFEEELRYHRSVRHQPKASKHVARWLVRKSDNPQKTRLLLNFYTLAGTAALLRSAGQTEKETEAVMIDCFRFFGSYQPYPGKGKPGYWLLCSG